MMHSVYTGEGEGEGTGGRAWRGGVGKGREQQHRRRDGCGEGVGQRGERHTQELVHNELHAGMLVGMHMKRWAGAEAWQKVQMQKGDADWHSPANLVEGARGEPPSQRRCSSQHLHLHIRKRTVALISMGKQCCACTCKVQ